MRPLKIWICAGLALIAQGMFATNYYVVASGSTPTPPWTNWGWAHTNLREVVARAGDNDTVYVTNNATYYLTNSVAVTYAITIRSWRPDSGLDPTNTIINGNYPNTTNYCFRLWNSGAVLAGLTITNGCNYSGSGGGIYMYQGIITNCIITGNRSFRTDGEYGGGGVFLDSCGSSASRASIFNCHIIGNVASNDGGGIGFEDGYGPLLISGCVISGNRGVNGGGMGGYRLRNGLFVTNCLISSNMASGNGGVFRSSYDSAEFRNCLMIGNTASSGQGGLDVRSGVVLQNCLVANNVSGWYSGGLQVTGGKVLNCTVVSNQCHADANGGGMYINSGSPQVENTIVWGNMKGVTINNWKVDGGTPSFTNCCTTPTVNAYGTGNITDDPLFMSPGAGNWRLAARSPCVNTGINQNWMIGTIDLDGRVRIRYGRVDMGTYENIRSATIYTVR